LPQLIEVCFKGNRKEFFLWEGDDAPPDRAAVVVDADRGEDLGHVHATGERALERARRCAHGPGEQTVTMVARRLATADERKRLRELREQDESARRKAMERVKANGLVMKLSDAEWRWDRRKLTLYFTAEKRVDFRTLVRELAAQFRTRIELKQIGVRDEARRLSGVGRCGREYCSASWLPELRPVNLGVAKDQRLSLNPSQISGACGRLMCCLRYEHEFYVRQRKRFPKEGRTVPTSKGLEKVLANDIFRERVTLRAEDGETRILALLDLRKEMGAERTQEQPLEDEVSAPAFEDIPEEVIRLQDTVELPAWVPRAPSPSSVESRQRVLPVAPTAPPPSPAPPGPASLTPATRSPQPPIQEVSDQPGAPETAGEEERSGRRRRRRGRRGGRRNRDARNREQGKPGDDAAPGEGNEENGT
jgi:cell fate regulator YaaT (PSP1 superfamily)